MSAPTPMPTLICLPYAGSGPHLFAPWQRRLHGRIEIVAPVLPGRGSRLLDPPIPTLPALVDWLRHELRDALRGDFSLWGHSMGALLAYELTRALVASGLAPPRHLFVSGALPPQLPRWTERYHDCDDATLIGKLTSLSGTPPEVLADDDLMALLLPTLRADFAVCETYAWQPQPQAIDVPITVVGGDRDPDVPVAKLDGWRACTRGPVRIVAMAGHHFFLSDQVEALAEVFCATLAPPLRAGTTREA